MAQLCTTLASLDLPKLVGEMRLCLETYLHENTKHTTMLSSAREGLHTWGVGALCS